MPTTAEVVREFESWVGVRYTDEGRTREGGVDCAGLLIAGGKNLGVTTFDFLGITRVEKYHNFEGMLDEHLTRLEDWRVWRKDDGLTSVECFQRSAVRASDVVMMRYGRAPTHCAVAVDARKQFGLYCVHATPGQGQGDGGGVVRHLFDENFLERILVVYRIPGVVEG